MKKALALISLGIVVRLIFALFFNHLFDFNNILELVKSVANTGNLFDGFSTVKNSTGHTVQLYGKIYYQIAAVWLFILNGIKSLIFSHRLVPFNGASFLYQLASIKLVQFLYDFLLLFFLIKITQLLFPRNQKYLNLTILFWSLNPFIIYTAYVPFQSDLAMIACMTGGIYYGLSALMQKPHKVFSKKKMISVVLLTLGAVIKQVPLLLIPAFFILLSENIISFLFLVSIFIFSYLFFSQPWSPDAHLIRERFMYSEESLGLFTFNLNGVSIFLLLYSYILFFVLIFKKEILEKPIRLLYTVTLIIVSVYLSQDSRGFFSQFSIWILPSLYFLMLDNNLFSLFLLIPFLGFYRWALADTDALSGSLSASLGSPLHQIPGLPFFISLFVNPQLVFWLVNSLFALFSLLLFILLNKLLFFADALTKMEKSLKAILKIINIKTVIIGLFFLYVIILVSDTVLESRFVNLTATTFTPDKELTLEKNPLNVVVSNPQKKLITGIKTKITLKGNPPLDGFISLKIKDLDTNKIIDNQKKYYSEFINRPDNYLTVFLKPTYSKHISIDFINTYGYDQLFIETGSFAKLNQFSFRFAYQPVFLDIIGSYTIRDMANNFGQQISIKPVFYAVYLGGIIFFSLVSALLVLP